MDKDAGMISVEAVDAEAVKVKSLSINESSETEVLNAEGDGNSLANGKGEAIIASDTKNEEEEPLPMYTDTKESQEEHCRSNSKSPDSEIKKRSNFAHQRNYRKRNQALPDEESNDGLATNIPSNPRTRNNEAKRHSEEDTSEEHDLPQTKYMKQDEVEDKSRAENGNWHYSDSEAEARPQYSSATSTNTGSPGGDSDDFSDQDSSGLSDGEESPAHSVELGDHDTSSDSSHGIVFKDEGPSSSSSSDNFLEDLDERCKYSMSISQSRS
jgi:hypothetical protein